MGMIELLQMDLLLILLLIAALAGFIDAIAGGGGLLVLPALLWFGLTPEQALATNKLQAVFGSGSATLHFLKQGAIKLREMRRAILCTFIGAACGTITIQLINPATLARLLPILLISFAIYFLFSPRVGDQDAHPRVSPTFFAFTFAFAIGFYDGFFGPGTGSFFAMAFVMFLGFNLIKATAHAKLLNFISNLAALLFFMLGGHVMWQIGLLMAIGQFIGAYFGAHLVLRHGTYLIRPVLVIISLCMTVKLLFF